MRHAQNRQNEDWRCGERKHSYRLYASDGEHWVGISTTPSDVRSIRNSVAQMRRYGFKWKGR